MPGYLRYVGRAKDMIVTGGVNVYAAEVEGALLEHPAISGAAVFGLPDARWGSASLRRSSPPPIRPEVAMFLRTRLAPYKIPKQWEVVDELPMTASGKVQKFELQRRFHA